jgi:uncharacterized repeat protein (TIGR03803 family)
VSPRGGLVMDPSGNLYGTTSGGALGYGEIFELSPSATAGTEWHKTVLYRFSGGDDGSTPEGGLIFDAAGNLYGTTSGGGGNQAGTVFELTPG